MVFNRLLKAVFGDQNVRVLKELQPLVDQIGPLAENYSGMGDEDLCALTPHFKERLAAGESLDDLLPEAFAVVREVASRVVGMRPFDVQLLGGIVLHQGRIAEMATGEGKTLVAVAPAYLNALQGDGVFVVTVNDYLAKRDRDWMAPVFEALGLSVGAIQSNMDPAERRNQYACDVTYGTNNEFGFDYLRDNMKSRPEDQVQAKLNFAIIDEVDSILVDEARTPLIISGLPEESTQLYGAADRVARKLSKDTDFEVKEKEHVCVLTEDGIEKAEGLAGVTSFYSGENMAWPHHLEQALRAHYIYHRDKDYVVQKSEEGTEVVIVDEHTGRLMPGRRWSDGLHQAVESKEGVRPKQEMQTLATITFQNYFRLYTKISGMTGTAMTEAGEFHKIYGLDVVVVPTNQPVVRSDENDVIFRMKTEKWVAIADEIESVHATGQPLLVGTISIEDSEHLSGILGRRGVKHEVLNAKNHSREAEIVMQAGRKGAVTVATNMAGRGTDIKLGGNAEAMVDAHMNLHPDDDRDATVKRIEGEVDAEAKAVVSAGGLYVLGTERHEARRIDNQLRGRSGRQGDPGRTRFYLSLEDNLMRIFAREWVSGLLEKLGMTEGQEIQSPMVSRGIEKAQKRVETRNFEIRKSLLDYDEVMDTQRQTIYGQRQSALEGDDLKETILDMFSDVVGGMTSSRFSESETGEPDLDGLKRELQTRFGVEIDVSSLPTSEGLESVTESVLSSVSNKYEERETQISDERMRSLERFLVLNTIDSKWKDHLREMDVLKRGIGLRGYAQQDPRVEYKREGYEKFEEMLGAVAEEVTTLLLRLEIHEQDNQRLETRWAGQKTSGGGRESVGQAGMNPESMAAVQQGRERAADMAGRRAVAQPVRREGPRIGRNEPCPCGSGKKYKRCCGRKER